MKFKLLNESIKQTAYMMRQDGKVFELPKLNKYDVMHPYICDDEDNTFSSLGDFDDIAWTAKDVDYKNVDWFIEHTTHQELKEKLIRLKEYMQQYNQDINAFDDYADEALTLAKECNTECNEEFLRIRIGGSYDSNNNYGAYFRVSSNNFNWFDNIYYWVSDNKHYIDNITITKDHQAGKGSDLYKYKGQYIDKMPVDKFLTISGNLLIEDKKDKK